MPLSVDRVTQEIADSTYDGFKNDHYLRHCLTQQDAMGCYNCLAAYKNNATDSNKTLLNSPIGNKLMATSCIPAGRSINVLSNPTPRSGNAFCPVDQQCAGFTKINSPRHSCTAEEITQIKSCAGGTNPVQAPTQNTCRAECVNNDIIGVSGVKGLPICHQAYPGEGDTDEDFNKDYVKLTETQCNTSVDFDQDGDGVVEDLSEIYYWSSPLSGPECKNNQRQYTTTLKCSEVDKRKLRPGLTCENIVSNYTFRNEPVFCKTGSGNFCSNDDSFDVMDGQEAGRCYGPVPIFGLRGNVDGDGTPIFIDELSDKDNKYCRTRVSCDRNPTTKRCNVDADGGVKLNFCENQPGHPGILTSDNPVCQNSFAVNENIETAAALPEYEFADIPGEDVIKCAKNPWCDAGAVVAASVGGFAIGAALAADEVGGVLSAAQKTRRAALLASWFGLNGEAQVGAAGARDAANNPSSGDLPGTNHIRPPGAIPGLTCEDGLEGCGVSVNLVPEFMRQKPDANKLLDWWKDTSNCNVYWHEGNPVCCQKDYTCLRCDNLL